MKAKLIKEYPGSPAIGTIHSSENKTPEWKGTEFYEKHSEFWEIIREGEGYKQGNDFHILFYTNEEMLNILNSGFNKLYVVVAESPHDLSVDYLTKEQIVEKYGVTW